MNAGFTGIKAEDALQITFDFQQGETEGRQSFHAVTTDAMAMAHRPAELARLCRVFPRQGPMKSLGSEQFVARLEMKPRCAASARNRRLWRL